MAESGQGVVRVGIGGWVFEPWRGVFYPPGLAHKEELAYASRRLTSIEINSTYHGTQKADSFARWYDETPEDFVFAVKGPRFSTNRRVLAEAASSIERFFASGLDRLREKLGPINWQFAPTKRYEPEDFEAFLDLLPADLDGRRLRHAVEVRHASFATADFIGLLRAHGMAVVTTDKAIFPHIADPTASFVYARLQNSAEGEALGYPPDALDDWARHARRWAAGGTPDELPRLTAPPPPQGRDVFLYMIDGHKPKAPAAAMALIERLAGPAPAAR